MTPAVAAMARTMIRTTVVCCFIRAYSAIGVEYLDTGRPGSQLRRPNLDRQLRDVAVELRPALRADRLDDRRAEVDADVGSFVRREDACLRMLDPSLGNF